MGDLLDQLSRGGHGGLALSASTTGFSGTCIRDTWTKPKGGRIKGRRWGWLGWGGREVGEK